MRTIALLLCVASGCVSTGKYQLVRDQLQEKHHRLLRCDAELVSMRAQRQRAQEGILDIETDRARLQATLAAAVRDRAALAATAEDLVAALAASQRRKAEAEVRVLEFQAVLAQLRDMIDAGKLEVKIVDGRMVLALPTDVLFRSGSAELSPAGNQAIAEITGGLLGMAERRFQVEGHTDNVPIRNARFPSNWELGAARAISIVNRMVAVGMSPDRVSAASFGETRPVAGNDTAEGRGANRRIEIVVVPDLSLLPGYEELNQAVEGR